MVSLFGTDDLARAATALYVSPSGSGSLCSQASPCALTTAITDATVGDTVLVASGGYSTTAEMTNSNGIKVEGGSPMPVITSSASSVGLLLTGAGSTISQLDVQDTGGGEAVSADGTGALINQVSATANSSTPTAGACVIDGSAALLRDSLCTNSGAQECPPTAGPITPTSRISYET